MKNRKQPLDTPFAYLIDLFENDLSLTDDHIMRFFELIAKDQEIDRVNLEMREYFLRLSK